MHARLYNYYEETLRAWFSLAHKQLIYVTEFAKRGLPHTSNFLTFKDHNLMSKYDRNLKLTLRLMPC